MWYQPESGSHTGEENAIKGVIGSHDTTGIQIVNKSTARVNLCDIDN